MKNTDYVIETVTWIAKEGVTKQAMELAVNNMLEDLVNLPGFIHETLSTDQKGRWLMLYYWDNVQNAHNSNTLMAEKKSLLDLIELIVPNSVDINVYENIQSSSEISTHKT